MCTDLFCHLKPLFDAPDVRVGCGVGNGLMGPYDHVVKASGDLHGPGFHGVFVLPRRLLATPLGLSLRQDASTLIRKSDSLAVELSSAEIRNARHCAWAGQSKRPSQKEHSGRTLDGLSRLPVRRNGVSRPRVVNPAWQQVWHGLGLP